MAVVPFLAAWNTRFATNNAYTASTAGSRHETAPGDGLQVDQSEQGGTTASDFSSITFEAGGTTMVHATSGDFSGAVFQFGSGQTSSLVTSGGMASIGWTSTQSGAFGTIITNTTGTGTGDTVTATAMTTTSFSTSTSTSVSGGFDSTFFQPSTTSASTLTYAGVVSTAGTQSTSVPSTTSVSRNTTVRTTSTNSTGGTINSTKSTTSTVPATTTASISFSATTTTTSASTSTLMVMAGITLTISKPVELCDPTYFVPDNQVAWVCNAGATNAGLSKVEDLAYSALDTFTVPPFTSLYANDPVGAASVPITYHGVVATTIGTTETTQTFLTSQTTVVTLSTFGAISNSTSTVTSTTGATTTMVGTVSEQGTTTEGSNVANATTTTSTLIQLAATSVGYIEEYDADGNLIGFVTVLNQCYRWTTAEATTNKAASFSTMSTSPGATFWSTADGGETHTIGLLEYGFVLADTYAPRVLNPFRPAGVCLAVGLIQDRLPHVAVKAGALQQFPAFYAIGQQVGISCPFPAAFYTATDSNSASWSVKFDSISVSVTKGVTTSNMTTSGVSTASSSTTLSLNTPITGSWWTDWLPVDYSAYGGATPDGRLQQVLIRQVIIDETVIHSTTENGSVARRADTYFNQDPADAGLAWNLMPAYDVRNGPNFPGGDDLLLALPFARYADAQWFAD